MPIKYGIVASGGGNHCGATAGALHALYKVHRIEMPHVIVAVSGGTQPALCYMARRFRETYEWPRLFTNPRYVNRWRFWRMMDIDVLVDEILVPQIPSLYREAGYSQTKLFIAATQLPSGAVRWFTNQDFVHGGKLKKATSAVPGIYGKHVEIEGERFIDGSFAVTLAECVEKAFAEGADKVVLIDVQRSGIRAGSALALKALSWKQGKEVRDAVKRFAARKKRPLSSSDTLVVCRPPVLATKHPLDVRRLHTARGIEQGYEAMASLKI